MTTARDKRNAYNTWPEKLNVTDLKELCCKSVEWINLVRVGA
jgi:hypothetical protein